uniref:conjugal transfer protein TraO n=1 Tax=Achromobacter insuavis TaxID=1287735 RepID=UPI001F136E1F
PPVQNAPQQGGNGTQATLHQEQLSALLDSWKAPESGIATVSKENGLLAASYPVAAAVPPGASPAAQQQQQHLAPRPTAQRPVVGGFETVPALLDTAIDTDENSVVEATIPVGPFAGARVRAAGYKRINESVDMTFTEMWFNQRMYRIVAKPQDQTTGRTALSGDVNRRWFERIILPAFAKGLGATAQKFENAGNTAVTTPLGGVVQTFPNMPSAASIAGTFIAGVGSQAGEVMANDASQIPQKQVLIPAGTTIGIKFLAPVLASDEIGIDKSASAGFDAQTLNTLSQPASQPNPPPPTRAPAMAAPYGVPTQPGYVQPPRGYLQPY